MLKFEKPVTAQAAAQADNSYTLATTYTVEGDSIVIRVPLNLYEQQISSRENKTGKRTNSVRFIAQPEMGDSNATICVVDPVNAMVQDLPVASSINGTFSLGQCIRTYGYTPAAPAVATATGE